MDDSTKIILSRIPMSNTSRDIPRTKDSIENNIHLDSFIKSPSVWGDNYCPIDGFHYIRDETRVNNGLNACILHTKSTIEKHKNIESCLFVNFNALVKTGLFSGQWVWFSSVICFFFKYNFEIY